jgi:hypothetical protein
MPNLAHDKRLIEVLALVHEGNAKAKMRVGSESQKAGEVQRKGWAQHTMLSASSFVIAASCWSLLDPRKAVEDYRNAMRLYRSMEHDYWAVLALASMSFEDMEAVLSAIDEMSEPGPQIVAFGMVCNAISHDDRYESRAERLNKHRRRVGDFPVGRLGISLEQYARCAEAFHAAREKKDGRERLLREGSTYVRRASEVLRGASHDRFHWLRLQSTILPAEPEAVAMTTAMSMLSHSMFGISMADVPDLDEHGQLLVEVGEAMYAVQGPQ